MRIKLLRKLRTEIQRNTHGYLGWSVWLETSLNGVNYSTDIHSGWFWIAHEDELYKEMEHIALAGYVKQQREK